MRKFLVFITLLSIFLLLTYGLINYIEKQAENLKDYQKRYIKLTIIDVILIGIGVFLFTVFILFITVFKTMGD